MKADPALAEEMRAVVLDEELRSLPAVVKRLADSLTELVEAAKTHSKRLSRLEGLWGGYFETKWKEDGPSYLSGRGFRRAHFITKDALGNLIEGAEDPIYDDICLADTVHSAIARDTANAVYIVTEVSSRIHRDDIERAIRRASLLNGVLGIECLAAVAGASIDDVAETMAEENGVMVFMPYEWQQLAA